MKTTNPQTTIQHQLKESLFEAFHAVNPADIFPYSTEDVILEHPTDPGHGDYSSNIAMKAYRQLAAATESPANKIVWADIASNPFDLAEKIVTHISLQLPDFIEKVEAVKPGFINIYLSKLYLIKQLDEIIANKENYGRSNTNDQKILIEFAHPNTHKLFHIGHLRNITLGESLSRIMEWSGNTVYRTNYQGDVGMHIAKCLWAILQLPNYTEAMSALGSLDEKIEFLGKYYAQGSQAYENSEPAKEEINHINKEIYLHSREIAYLYDETRRWSLEYFDRIYKRLYTNFDRLYFEHEVWQRGQEIVNIFLGKNVFEKSEGAVIFPGEKYGLHNRVFINSKGLPTYEAKDMGLGELQYQEYRPDRLIHLVGPEQTGYFEVVFKALEIINPELAGKEFHKSYGWVRLKEGKMSSRLGNVVTGESLIDAAREKLTETFRFEHGNSQAEVLEEIAVGAVKYSMLKYSPETEFVFDINESVSLEGNSGPYLQYTYARCKSVISRSERNMTEEAILDKAIKLEPLELQLLRSLYRFPEVAIEAGTHLAPNIICNFLYDLAQKYNLFYNECPILRADKDVSIFRLQLTEAVSQLLKNGLHLLGIKAPEKM